MRFSPASLVDFAVIQTWSTSPKASAFCSSNPSSRAKYFFLPFELFGRKGRACSCCSPAQHRGQISPDPNKATFIPSRASRTWTKPAMAIALTTPRSSRILRSGLKATYLVYRMYHIYKTRQMREVKLQKECANPFSYQGWATSPPSAVWRQGLSMADHHRYRAELHINSEAQACRW